MKNNLNRDNHGLPFFDKETGIHSFEYYPKADLKDCLWYTQEGVLPSFAIVINSKSIQFKNILIRTLFLQEIKICNKEVEVINQIQLNTSFIQENIIENTGLGEKYFYQFVFASNFETNNFLEVGKIYRLNFTVWIQNVDYTKLLIKEKYSEIFKVLPKDDLFIFNYSNKSIGNLLGVEDVYKDYIYIPRNGNEQYLSVQEPITLNSIEDSKNLDEKKQPLIIESSQSKNYSMAFALNGELAERFEQARISGEITLNELPNEISGEPDITATQYFRIDNLTVEIVEGFMCYFVMELQQLPFVTNYPVLQFFSSNYLQISLTNVDEANNYEIPKGQDGILFDSLATNGVMNFRSLANLNVSIEKEIKDEQEITYEKIPCLIIDKQIVNFDLYAYNFNSEINENKSYVRDFFSICNKISVLDKKQIKTYSNYLRNEISVTETPVNSQDIAVFNIEFISDIKKHYPILSFVGKQTTKIEITNLDKDGVYTTPNGTIGTDFELLAQDNKMTFYTLSDVEILSTENNSPKDSERFGLNIPIQTIQNNRLKVALYAFNFDENINENRTYIEKFISNLNKIKVTDKLNNVYENLGVSNFYTRIEVNEQKIKSKEITMFEIEFAFNQIKYDYY